MMKINITSDVMWTIMRKHQTNPFPGGSGGKEYACNAGDPGSIPELGRSPREVNGCPLQYAWLENPHGQRSLAGYSPWGHKESDMTECLHTHKPQLRSILQKIRPLPFQVPGPRKKRARNWCKLKKTRVNSYMGFNYEREKRARVEKLRKIWIKA